MKRIKYFLLLFISILLIQLIWSCPLSYANSTLHTYSPSCILIEKETGQILYEKDSHKIMYPASTTKIMTAILAVEKCKLTDIATVSHNAIFTVPSSYVNANIKEGEELTIEQLLHILLIPSANDAANVLAEHISGSVDKFADLMNEKAKEIGCLNTHFVNANGIYNKNHTTTAYDLALMGKYAMNNKTIRDIVKKTTYTLPTTNKYNKTDRIFHTTNDLLRENYSKAKDNYYYPNAIGIKTGYTSEAGSCIIAGAKKDNLEVIVVILGAESTKDGLSQRYLDCINLFNYAFDHYKIQTVNEKNSILQQITVKGATKDTKNLEVLVQDEISILLPQNMKEELTPEIVFQDKLKAPISVNSVIGTITYHVDGETYSSNLIAGNSVIASSVLPILIRIVLIMVTVYLIYLLLRNPKDKNLNKKKFKKHSYKKNKGGGHFRFTSLNNLK